MNKVELKRELEASYPHQHALLKRIECVYIPVTHAARTKAFFMQHGLITLSPQGNVKLASGQGIFFLETRTQQSSNFMTHDWEEHNPEYEMESICFEVADARELFENMKRGGARVSDLIGPDGCGLAFHFYDPDGNKYTAWQDTSK